MARMQLRAERRWWWLVGWALPNLAELHDLHETARRASAADLPWHGLPPTVSAQRSLGGMTGHQRLRGGEFHAAELSLCHGGPDEAYLTVTVRLRHDDDVPPLAGQALSLVRGTGLPPAAQWRASTPEGFRQLQRRAFEQLTSEPLEIHVDGAARRAEHIRVDERWAAHVPLAGEAYELVLTAKRWPTADLAVVTITDLSPYVAGSRTNIGPLLLPRRPAWLRSVSRLP